MPDANPATLLDPADHIVTKDPSYSVEVPNQGGASTYFRLGGADPTSQRETNYWDGVPSKPGVLMLSPGRITQVATDRVVLQTTAEALTLAAEGSQVINATYTFAETGSYRDVAYRIGHNTAWAIGDTETYKVANTSEVAVGNDQKLNISTGFVATMGANTEIKLGLLATAITQAGTTITSPIFGNYKTSTQDTLEGGQALTLTLNPLNAGYLGKVTLAVTALKVLTGLLATVAVTGGVFGPLFWQLNTSVNATAGKAVQMNVDDAKDKLRYMSYAGLGALGLLTVLQAAFVLLGGIAAACRAAGAAGVFPKIELTPGGLKLSVGVAELTMTPASITTKVGAAQTTLTAGMHSMSMPILNTVAGPASLRLGGPGVTAAGPAVSLQGTVSASVNAPAVLLAGTTSATIQSPAINFLP